MLRLLSNRDTREKHKGKKVHSPLLKVYLLGQFRLERFTGHEWQRVTNPLWQHRSVRMLLAYLLSSPGRRRGREQVIEELWPDLDVENATNRLNTSVHQIRKNLNYFSLEPELARPAASRLLRLEADVLILGDASDIWVDVDTFSELIARAQLGRDSHPQPLGRDQSGPYELAEELLEEAVALYGGDFLQGERHFEWVLARREVHQRNWISLLLELADRRMAHENFSGAIDALNTLLMTDPANEAAVRRLMLSLTRLDRHNEALNVYHRLAKALQENYGVVPLSETHELFEAACKGDISGHPPGALDHPPDARSLHQRNTSAEVQIGRSHQSPLIGRTAELEKMRQVMFVTEQGGEQPAPGHLPAGYPPTGHPPAGYPQGVPLHFLLLRGDTGIGKTRLAEELSREANKRGWSVAWIRSYEQESDIPYRLWTEILRKAITTMDEVEYAQLINPDSAGAIHRAPIGSNAYYLSMLLPELQQKSPATPGGHKGRHYISQEQDEQRYSDDARVRQDNSQTLIQEQLHLWEATCRLLATISHKRPLLVVMDDLQWADDSSLELLAYFTRYLQIQSAQRILLVGTCRDSELAAFHPLQTLISDLQREQAITTISVQPLNQAQIGALVAPLPDTIVQDIQTQAAGNPFFAEELARYSYSASALDTIHHSPTNFAEHEQLDVIHLAPMLPETITVALDRRMSNLSGSCQRLLGKAAVLGGSFEFNLLRLMQSNQTTALDEDILIDLLDEALQAGVLTEESTGRHIVYHFWHPMIVSHLYAQLSVARRTRLHHRAAEALRQLNLGREEEVAAAIVQHLLKGGGDPQHIALCAEMAGNRAYALSAYPEAQHHYLMTIAQKALVTTGRGQAVAPTMARKDQPARGVHSRDDGLSSPLHLALIHERLGECFMVQGNYDEAYTHYEQVLKIRSTLPFVSEAERQREAQIQALLWYEMGRARGHASNFADVQQCNQRGEQVLRDAGVTSGVAWACLRLQYSNKCYDEGNYDEARSAALEGVKMFEEDIQQRGANRPPVDFSRSTRITRTIEGDLSELGNIYETLGIIAGTTGQIAGALMYFNTALAIFEEQNSLRSMANACNNIGTALLLKTEQVSADEYFHCSLSLAERVGDLPLVSTVSINLGDLATLAGNLLEAETWYRRSLELATRVNIRSDMCHVNSALAINLQDQGKLSDAIEALRRALALGREIKSPPITGIALITLANLRMTMVEEQQAASNVDVKAPIYSNRLKRIQATLQHALALNGLRAEEMAKGQLAQATTYLWQGALEAAEEIAFQTMKVVEEQQHFQLLSQAQRLLGCILSTAKRCGEAEQYFRQAIQISRDYNMRLEHARTLYCYGQAMLLRNCPPEVAFQQALSYLYEAQEIFAACHAVIDLEKVKRILSGHTSG